MPFLIATLACLGAICALDLILTLGVIKRLREHTELLSARSPADIPVGAEVAEFAAVTTDGEPLSRESMKEETVVAFFSPTCGPCKEKLPRFVDFARGLAGGRESALAVVVGDVEEGAPFITELNPVVRVVVESGDGPLGSAFKVAAFPTLVRVAPDGAGKLVVTDNRIELGHPAAAAA
ncbi:TlpA family protein disulfide reductase [Streptomyces sp. NPDC096176]|uniref:TlpA family protein disulfide reductase n=1 Tax=Streptomyces sp. NPDC096176 TaxID=3366079 RepID=UPI0037F2731B